MTNVLIIDDDSQMASLAGRWLSAAGYEVEILGSFADADARIRARVPDVLVADVRLSGFNGLQLGILARERRPAARIVLISGWDDPVLRREAEALGAAYLCKPLSAGDLVSAIQRAGEIPDPHAD